MQIFRVAGSSQSDPNGRKIKIRCPACRHRGTFDPVQVHDVVVTEPGGTKTLLGQRRCPNDECKAHIFFAWKDNQIVVTYPPERIDFDASGIPPAIASALDEGLTCHAAGSYRAAAMMIRRTLEELCHEKGATGKGLKERISALQESVTISRELLDGLDNLRMLGNDAAHVEARDYDHIGRIELEVAMEFTKVLLKAVYQHEALLSRLKALGKPS